MAFRTRHKASHGKYVYAIRTKKGRFKDIENIGRAIKDDSRIKAKHRPLKRRQGFMGDYASPRRWGK